MLKRSIKTLLFSIIIIFISFFTINHLQSFEEVDTIGEPSKSIIKEEQFETERKDDEKDLYQIIEESLLEGKGSVEVQDDMINGDQNFLYNTVEKVLMSNPEIMYYQGGRYGQGLIEFEYSKAVEEIKHHQNFIRKKREEIIYNSIKPEMSDYEKVKIIHDYIVNSTKYDRRYMNNEKVPEESHTVYGVLHEGIALCGGYAKTMKYLLDAINIESMVIIGKAGSDNHAWNIVNIDGYYYHIDTTWDDPITEDGSHVLSYDYFNLKDEDIEKTHSWDRSDYPICNSNQHNYYYYNGLVVSNYDDFYNKIEDAILKKVEICELRVLDLDKTVYNIPDTINSIVKNKVQLIDLKEYRYSINDEQGIIKIELNYSK